MSVNTGRYRPDRTDTWKKKFGSGDNVPRENTAEARLNQVNENIKIDALYGFHRVTDVKERIGFLLNMHATDIVEDDKQLVSGVDYYFIEEDFTRFKVSLPYEPYFYVLCRKDTIQEVSTYLFKKFSGFILKIEIVIKEDLDLPNHLIGLKQRYLKLKFSNLVNLMKVKRDIMSAVRVNKEREKNNTYYDQLLTKTLNSNNVHEMKKTVDHMDNILDIREHDVPHHVRVSIDLKIFVGAWYSIKTCGTQNPPIITRRDDIVERPEPIVLAYDIETTKLPLKFPDANSDQIMMISYMIDAQGYLITNREIISADIEDFEYTPKPEFEGVFTVFNEPNEKALIKKFFDHINDVKPHVFVSYNGDFFDWPFVETRAAIHGMDMKERIGFSKNKDGVYVSRPAMHMDCLCWVKRDSYLPVGSQNLKAVAKAKLRYDPVELDPEEMCRLASEEPTVLASYSVSDAVATFYLYQKYVHPFIFALSTIIPMEPDEVLRKGSGTLCETLLMVEAYHANIIYPNKQEAEFNKLTTDGHVLDQETYVGGHVEALESGVFRADIPYKFKIVPTAVEKLIDGIEGALKYAIEEEEKISLDLVTNFGEILDEIKTKLTALKDQPFRMEKPVIYHLDVGAMYPNIILTNRLQPSAMVNETVCAACDYNKPGALCQRNMKWMWRGETMPASLGEYQRIQQQLEMEKFPSAFPGGARRAFHQLSKQEQAQYEKKRLTEFCRKAYRKTKITRTEERTQTICQRENSFYVDTVRAFRDRRYEYKGMTKVAKQQVAAAMKSGDAAEIKLAKGREVLYDSLQLAHKCILNSFYGYVMRRGSRWFSMEMGGIVCYTGAHIIMKAREIVEKVGRPLELDTDGIWCILPASFPDNVVVKTTHPKKSKITISYPNAVLNFMVKDEFTNDVYHDLVNKENLTYNIRSENSIFFEVDGPYLAMVLPASKEEGKKLKKRYAVFNFDGSLAELKGFEIKRRGELQLIKIFQSSVFESFLKGETLEECYASVAKVADYWLDILFSKGSNLPDSELFELISENKSMSRTLEDYGSQKSTSISTAKRLAEFLGDQMVKDAGLACKYIISKKPEGSPVTERAIPLAIFQSEPSVTRHYLRKWLKDPSIQEPNIREILDWSYYIERLGSAIQKIITIPAAMQGIANPVPRVKHPDWLYKKVSEKNKTKSQMKINEIFKTVPKEVVENLDSTMEADSELDIEDIGTRQSIFKVPLTSAVSKRKRVMSSSEDEIENNTKSWMEVLGNPPPMGTTRDERIAWIEFHKKKWAYQLKQKGREPGAKRSRRQMNNSFHQVNRSVVRNPTSGTLGGFLKRAQEKLLITPWQIIQIVETNEPGLFRLWALVDQELHQLRLIVPRIFYVNRRILLPDPTSKQQWQKCSKILPRGRPVFNLYRYTVDESKFRHHKEGVLNELMTPDIEGIYESQMTLEFRAILQLGCVCTVDQNLDSKIAEGADTFNLEQLTFKSVGYQPYLEQTGALKYIFLYHHWSSNHQRAIWGLFLAPSKRCHVFVLNSAKTSQMPNMGSLYVNERNLANEKQLEDENLKSTPETLHFEVKVETDSLKIYKAIQVALKNYKNEMKGATILVLQTAMEVSHLTNHMPMINEFPFIKTHIADVENLYSTLEWQKIGAKAMIRHYLECEKTLHLMLEQCRYFHAPVGNIPMDATLFGADLFYARHLQKNNFVLWCSPTEKPDFGGSENDDNRLLTDFEDSSSCEINKTGTYSSVCVELEIDSLAVNTLLQAHHVNDVDGTSSFVAFHSAPQATLQEMIAGESTTLGIPSYDETALCSAAFKVLRNMVNAWLRDVTIYKNMFADYQIIHFYRWLRSPQALLYDPALRRTLHSYMKKLFLQLIAEFQRLGSVIVFANFNKIILCTKKRTVPDALGYVEYIDHSIRRKELFHSIDIRFEKCWEYLIWLDLTNHGGVRGKVPKSVMEESQAEQNMEEEEENEEEGPEIIMNWNLMEYLPKEASCQTIFSNIIAGYINAIYQHISDNEPGNATPRPRQRSQSVSSQSFTQRLGLADLENTAQFAKALITGEMSQKLFQLVQKIHKKLPEKVLMPEECPHLGTIVSGKRIIKPAVEVTKAVCEVLSLDKEVTEEISNLKENLLKLVNVSVYSDEAEWRDPSVSFTLPEVICQGCNHTRDIDLSRDNFRAFENNRQVWKCPVCEMSYENDEIEMALLDLLNRKTMAYILQDLQCRRCLEVKKDNIKELCSCGGNFKTLITKKEMTIFAMVHKIVAVKCQMEILMEALENTNLLESTEPVE
ncbi:DNA polymerase epsilon catalytic subunit 1 [Leptopilina boulardi]|uniref:DNA polymerase epsilon catalytic subunit 1 n=1 Tax=Leptopilina boulardi TaxID=63433 RepID=UPI0021F5C660|nr:DNA polymerase epsilon catalytic subunit 1 [Leptopilina boulardi]